MKYVVSFLGFIVIVVVAIALIRGGGNKRPAPKPLRLAVYANNSRAYVEYNTDGPINAEENHRTIRIIVNPSYRTIDILKGYQGEVLQTKTYPNNQAAYEQFLDAIARAGFTSNRKTNATYDSICPNGTRFKYRVVEGSKDIQNLWSASCTRGSFGGDRTLTRSLFQAQIPDYNKLTNNVSVGSSSASVL